MDRKTWLAVGLSIAALILWQWYYSATYGAYDEQQRALAKQRAAAAALASPTATPAAAATPVATPVAPSRPVMAARGESLSSEGKKAQAEFFFNNDTGGIEKVVLNDHRNENAGYVSLNGNREMPIGALEATPGTAMGGFEMTAERVKGVVTFTKREADGLEITKVFSLPAKGSDQAPYMVDLAITFHNAATTPLSRHGLYLSSGSAAPIHRADMPIYTRFDWSKDGKYSGIDTNWFGAGSIPLIGIQTSAAKDFFSEPAGPVNWVAVASQYFTTIVSATGETKGSSAWAARFVTPNSLAGQPIYGIQGALGLAPFTLEPGKSLTQKFSIYSGPKENARLKQLGQNEQAVLNFGWFGFISEFLLWAMNAIFGVVHDYGLAIIILTLCIKTALWPLQNKATDSMRKMAALSPKMTELREKYKDDPTKMNQELMKLYKDFGVNPFSGCLPMLIQIPIFFGFYGMLGIAIELRNSSFLWVHDLSQPDTIGHVLGFPINILPLVMAGTMVWQMAISPKSGDATQQRIIMFMPIIFVVFAYNYASALSLYWTTQNLFSIVQLYLTRNKPLPTLEKVKVVNKRAGGASKPRKKRPS
jgi:YidC/Oxa1 family membrane protein insertase